MEIDTIFGILKDNGRRGISLELLSQTAANVSQNIFTAWRRLNAIVERHEAIIRNRWKKKSVVKRRELLCSVLPDIPHMHRPDVDWSQSRYDEPTQPTSSTVMWPYINIEDLTDAKSLLIFMNARSRNRPATFASSELNFSPKAIPARSLDRLYPQARMNLDDQDPNTKDIKEETYGKITKYHSKAESRSASLGQDDPGYSVARGLQILQIQAGIMKFLVTCSEEIMHEIPLETLHSDLFPVIPEPPSLFDNEDTYNTFADASRRAPYCARETPDFSRIRHLISSVVQNAKDHVWTLREDPAYFAEYVQAYADHRHENLLDEAGKRCAVVGTKKLFHCVLEGIVKDAYTALIFGDKLSQECDKLEGLYRSSRDRLANETLRRSYSDTLEFVYCMLRFSKNCTVSVLEEISLGSPQLRHLTVRATTSGRAGYIFKMSQAEDAIGRDVQLFLSKIISDKNAVEELGLVEHLHFDLDLLETFCQKIPEARRKLSPLIESELTRLSIWVECVHQLRIPYCHAELAATFDHLEEHPVRSKLMSEFWKSLESWSSIMCCHPEGVIAPNLGDPTDGKFNYPAEDVHSKQTVEARRKAERNLDRVWRYVDKSFRKHTGCSQHESIQRLFDEGGPMRRTAPWQEA
jgi:hypothetical protein